MIQAIALDDERPALSVIEAFCERIDFVDLRKTFTRTGDARTYLNENPVDLLFADINMPTESGLDFYRATPGRATPDRVTPDRVTPDRVTPDRVTPDRVTPDRVTPDRVTPDRVTPDRVTPDRVTPDRVTPDKSNGSWVHPKPTMVIFTTAYGEYAVESYELQAVDYLLKPFTFERFLQAVNRAADYAARQPRPAAPPADAYIHVRADYTLYKIALADILFIEGLDNYLKIYLRPLTSTGSYRIITARMTMKAITEKLPGVHAFENAFVRVHRSYIVPIRRIEAIQSKTLLVAGHEIPIGATYEKEFLEHFRA